MTTIPPEAIEAAGLAAAQMAGDWYCPRHPDLPRRECPWCVAEVALAAALPHIEAAIRAQVASEIDNTQCETAERSDEFVGGTNLYERGKAYGLSVAARIARGDASAEAWQSRDWDEVKRLQDEEADR